MWREVSLFSARKVGERVHTLPRDWARASRCSWVETVRYFGERKNVSGRSRGVLPSAGLGVVPFPALRVKTSPAPSQSEDVIIGGWVWVKLLEEKKVLRMVMASDLSRRRAEFRGNLERRWGRVRRNSRVWYLFCRG